MTEFTLWDILHNLLLATRWTIVLSLIAFAGGIVVGLPLTIMRVSKVRALRMAVLLYIELFQGTPLLMQLFLAFFGLGLFGINVSPWSAASVALTLFSSAYLAEIWRGCIEAIPRNQWEAAASLGLSYLETMRHIILPQAMRIAIPPTVGFSVQIVKGTAQASIIGFAELTKVGTILNNATLRPFTVFALVAVIYFALCYSLSIGAKRLEKNFNVTRRT